MKKIFVLAFMALFSVGMSAAPSTTEKEMTVESVSISVDATQSDATAEEITQTVLDLLNELNLDEDQLECTVTVTITVMGQSVSMTVSGPCDELIAEIGNIINELEKQLE